MKLFAGLLLGMGAALSPGFTDEGEGERSPAAETYRDLVRSLERRYPDRDSVQEAHGAITLELRGFLERWGDSPVAGKARALLGEVLLVGGNVQGAMEVWQELYLRGPTDEDRARGLYLLGENLFLRARTAREIERSSERIRHYLGTLAERFPDSRWTPAARRILEYLDLIKEGKAPSFSAVFLHGNDRISYSLESLEGKLVFMIFWKASTPRHRQFESELVDALSGVIQEYPVLSERIQVLGVYVGLERHTFEAMVREWRIHWPQLYDGLGFEGPVARAFRIPRAPHFAIIGPGGKLLYLGPDEQEFSVQASEALKELRQSLESTPSEAEDDG